MQYARRIDTEPPHKCDYYLFIINDPAQQVRACVRSTLCYDDAKGAWLPFDRFVEGRHSSGGCASVSSLNKSLLSLVPWLVLNMTEHDLVLDSAEYPPPAFAAERGRVPQRSSDSWYVATAEHSAANPPHTAAAVDGWDRQTDERTRYDTIRDAIFTCARKPT